MSSWLRVFQVQLCGTADALAGQIPCSAEVRAAFCPPRLLIPQSCSLWRAAPSFNVETGVLQVRIHTSFAYARRVN
jgi:hypothetical protein